MARRDNILWLMATQDAPPLFTRQSTSSFVILLPPPQDTRRVKVRSGKSFIKFFMCPPTFCFCLFLYSYNTTKISACTPLFSLFLTFYSEIRKAPGGGAVLKHYLFVFLEF